MILKVEVVGAVEKGVPRIVASTQDRRFKYEGGINQDMVDVLAGREKAFFEASMGPGGLEIGDEVEDPGW